MLPQWQPKACADRGSALHAWWLNACSTRRGYGNRGGETTQGHGSEAAQDGCHSERVSWHPLHLHLSVPPSLLLILFFCVFFVVVVILISVIVVSKDLHFHGAYFAQYQLIAVILFETWDKKENAVQVDIMKCKIC